MHFFNDTKVTVNIPAIYEILQNINEEIKLKFEINDKQGKFYLNPLTENINIKPKVEVKTKIKESTNENIEIKVKRNSLISEILEK